MRSISYKANYENDTYIPVTTFFRTIDKEMTADLNNVVQIYNTMGDDRKKETKIEKKDEFGNTVEEKKIEEKEED